MSRLLAATAVVCALSAPALVGALTGPALAQADNQSDALSNALRELVQVLDINKDGSLDRAEIEAVKSPDRTSGTERAVPADESARKPRGGDADGDGFVSKEEFVGRAEKRFARLDTNGDGKLDEAEREAGRRAWKDKRHHRHDERGGWRRDNDWSDRNDRPQGEDRSRGDHDRGGRRADRMFERFDADGDGVITRQEVEAARERWHDSHGKDRG
jgi:Ca2+-binding EF-hand superfamily protein